MFQGMEYVYKVYREGSFSRAAQELYISQPSLSAAVKRVEQKVGYPLFDRSTKPLQLTECGKRYIEAVRRIMMAQEDFEHYVNDLGSLRTGKLILGGTNLYASWVLPAIMSKFAARYPHVELEIVEDSTSRLVKLLQRGDVDLILDNTELDDQIFRRYPYKSEHILLAVPKSFPVNDRLRDFAVSHEMIQQEHFDFSLIRPVPLKLFSDHPFVLLKPENNTRVLADKMLEEEGVNTRILFETDQQMTAFNIACSGMGIAFISSTLAGTVPPIDSVIYYRLGGKYSRRNLSFYCKKGRYISEAMNRFVQLARQNENISDL